jgi:hypothetical protein
MSISLLFGTRFFLPLIMAVSVPGAAFAWHGSHEKVFDGQTRYLWSRTWHAQNSLLSPPSAYCVPRAPGRCDSDFKPGELAPSVPSLYGGAPYPAAAVVGFEPLGFERLGRVANELDVAGSLPLPAGSAPTAAPRR